jgi:16S rRNA (cytidine1402-2'-O)-methyltransferase
MWVQKSFNDKDQYGKLLLVPTPIGNLDDMTFRAIKELKEADLIAAEDTRQTRKLCNYFEIDKPLVSYHEHNKRESGQKLIAQIMEGKTVALVSDAGMPCISDPGQELVQQCVEEQITVIPLPGANAALTALIASGISTDQFLFYGFLPRSKKDKRKQLEHMRYIRETIIFYESPHRLKETVKVMSDVFGDRRMSISRELTKKFEEFTRGSIDELLKFVTDNDARGEYCIIVEGSKEEKPESESEKWWEELSIVQHVDYYIDNKEFNSKDAIKQVAVDRELPKREVYQAYHQ